VVYRHISTSRLGVDASRASLIAVSGRTVTSNGAPYATDHSHVYLVCSVCNVGVFCPNGWIDQDATWYGGGPLHSDIVLDGDPPPSRKLA